MINRVVLVGRLTKDPVLRKTPSGASVVSFTVACNRRVQTQEQSADYINCVAWNKVAELMAQYLHKGSLIGLEGRIQTRRYDDQTGRRVYVTEVLADNVQFLEPKGARSEGASNYVPNQNAYGAQNYNNNQFAQNEFAQQPAFQNANDFSQDYASSDTLDISSDDLPF